MKALKHTGGRWVAECSPVGNWWVRGMGGVFSISMLGSVQSETHNSEANAKRIVACVNAMDGLNPEAVPQLIPTLRHAIDLAKRTNLPASVEHFSMMLFALTGSRE